MIKKTEVYQASDGSFHETFEGAKQCDLRSMLQKRYNSKSVIPMHSFVSSLVNQPDFLQQILNCLGVHEEVIVNENSYGLYDSSMGEPLAGTPNTKQRYTMTVEYILDGVSGAFHQPEDLAKVIATNPYVTRVMYTPKEDN